MFHVSRRPKSCLSPGCINTQITRALRKKQRLYRKGCRSGTDKLWARFKRHRRSVDRQKRRDSVSLFQMYMSLAGSEQHKALLELLKSLNRNVFGISTLKTPSGNTVTSFKSKVDTLNRQSWQAQNK